MCKNQVIVIVAATGCGKSSQIPQILLDEGFAGEGSVVCTQPRRVAAWSLATRVAKERGCQVGEEVGYHVRFERVTSSATAISYVTDGILLNQFLYDMKKVSEYGLVIIDEVHERSLQLDLLLGVMKREIMRRKDLKVVIMSATMNTDIFSDFFHDAPVVKISGCHHPVQVKYWPKPSYTLNDVLYVIEEIVNKNKPDNCDVLVFLPGRPDIDAVAMALSGGEKRFRRRKEPQSKLDTPAGLLGKKLFVVEAHSELPDFELERIFDAAPPGCYKIILSTNVSESSITVEGLSIVVDAGFVNVKSFDGKTGVHRLETRFISKSEAEQRKGRVGRTQPGVCYRLYKESQLEAAMSEEEDKKAKPIDRNFRDFPQPMVELEDLSHLLLIMRRYGFTKIDDFPFISPPNNVNVAAAHADLCRLGALHASGSLTEDGERIATFPLHPRLSTALLEAAPRGCGYGMLLLASMLSAFSGGRRLMLESYAKETEGYADKAYDEVDTLMMLLDDFKDEKIKQKAEWFWDTYELNAAYLVEAISIYCQLKILLERHCGAIKTPDSRVGAKEAEEPFFDVRDVLRKVFAPNIATMSLHKNWDSLDLENGCSVRLYPMLCKQYPAKEKEFGGIEIFAVSDIRPTIRRTCSTPFLTCSFRMQ